MKQRFPRKLKKIAKKRKVAADGIIMLQSAITSALGAARLASIHAQPSFGNPAPKVLSTASAVLESAASIKNILSQIKPWQYYAKI